MSFGGPKHQRKVNECYPTRPGEEGAVSGKISVLTYYINAKPEKLVKVSACLEKKVLKDVQKERSGYNKVTLEIIEGIMSGCQEFFGSFAPTALTILDVLSGRSEVDLLTKLVGTFSMFSRMIKSSLSSMREETFFQLLTHVVIRLCTLTSGVSAPEDKALLHDAEVRAVQAILGMEDFRGPGGRDRLLAVLKALLGHLSAREPSSLEDDDLDAQEMAAFTNLLRGMSSASVPLFMEVFFSIFPLVTEESPKIQAIWLSLQLLIKHLPSGTLCVFVSEVFRQLEKANEPALSLLVDGLAELLLSNRGPLGYTALQISENLVRLLKKQRPSVDHLTRRSILRVDGSSIPPPKSVFTISNCLVSVLRNTNFAAQKYDIINGIINRAFLPRQDGRHRLTVSAPSSSLDVAPDHHSLATVSLEKEEEAQFRAVIWGVLFAMAEEALPPTILKLAFIEVPQRLFDSLFLMALNANSEFRLNSLVLFHRLLLNGLSFTGHTKHQHQNSRDSIRVFASPILPKTSLLLLAKFRSTMYKSLLIDNTQSPHICAIDGLFKAASIGEADFHHLVLSLSLEATLQDAVKSRNLERQVLTQLLLDGYVEWIGKFLPLPALVSLAQERLESLRQQSVHVFELESALDDYPPPLCLRSSVEPKFSFLTLTELERLFLETGPTVPSWTEEQLADIKKAFSQPYSPDDDEDGLKEAATRGDSAGRRSLFPASPKRPLQSSADSDHGTSRSATSTILAHHRPSLLGDFDGNLTVPAVPSITRHQIGSSVSLASSNASSRLSRASSVIKKPSFRSLNVSAESITSSNDIDDDEQLSVLQGDFSNLTTKQQERAREVRERSTSILQ